MSIDRTGLFPAVVPSILILAVAAGVSAGAELLTLTGQTVKGEVVALDTAGVTLKTTDGEVRTLAENILQMDFGTQYDAPPTTAVTDVELIDGTVLHCSAVAVKGERVEMTVLPESRVTAPLGKVYTVLRDAQDVKLKQEFAQLLRQPGRLDLLVRRLDGKLSGLEGTLGAGTEAGDAIEFTFNGRKLTPKLDKVQALVFVRKPDPDAPPAVCRLTDAARNTVVAKSLALTGPGVRVESVSGVTLDYPTPDRVTRFDFSRGKRIYLSDLEPAESSVNVLGEGKDDGPFRYSLEDVIKFGRNQSLYRTPIYLSRKAYTKGLSLHARTVLVYDIGGDYREFRAVLGADDSAGPDSRVRVTILGDGRELFRADVKREDVPRPAAVDVTNVRALRITVESESFDLGNQATLADVQVSK